MQRKANGGDRGAESKAKLRKSLWAERLWL